MFGFRYRETENKDGSDSGNVTSKKAIKLTSEQKQIAKFLEQSHRYHKKYLQVPNLPKKFDTEGDKN